MKQHNLRLVVWPRMARLLRGIHRMSTERMLINAKQTRLGTAVTVGRVLGLEV